MSCTNYKVIQLTNNNIGVQAINALMPLGNITRRISTSYNAPTPFDVTTSGADTVTITQKGFYKVIYNASLVAATADVMTVSLLLNGESVYTVSATTTVGGTANITLAFDTRVFANCASCSTNCPQTIQIQLGGVAITGGTSNLIVDSCVNG